MVRKGVVGSSPTAGLTNGLLSGLIGAKRVEAGLGLGLFAGEVGLALGGERTMATSIPRLVPVISAVSPGQLEVRGSPCLASDPGGR